MEDSDILKRFDNDKLIDVVKNYKRYGYDDEIRDYAINLLKERGWSVEDLKTFGYWENSDYEEALIQYKVYCRNSLIAVCVLVLSLCMLVPIYLVFVFMAYRNVCKFYQALGRKEEAVYLRGFGSFIIKHRAEKTARNITKNTTLIVPAHNIPAFKPAKEFIKEVSKMNM